MKKMLLILSAISLHGAISAMKNDSHNNPSSHHNKPTPVTHLNDDEIDHKQAEVDRKIREISEAARTGKKSAPEKENLSKEAIERRITALMDKPHPQPLNKAKL
jgi:hypothetical protein